MANAPEEEVKNEAPEASKKSEAKETPDAADATDGKKPQAKKPARPSRAKTTRAKKAPAKPAAKTPAKPAARAESAASTGASNGTGNGAVALPRLLESYRSEIQPVLIREFGYENSMQAPKLAKLVVNIGLGEALTSSNALSAALGDLAIITGQKARENKARKSIAAYKLREGQVIGASVTMRGTRMWHFFDRLVNIALPRVRDFRGVPRQAFDGRGNYTMGLTDQAVFPEIDYNKIDRLRGLQVVLVTSARTDEEGRRLLELLGVPFVRVDDPRLVGV